MPGDRKGEMLLPRLKQEHGKPQTRKLSGEPLAKGFFGL